MLTFERYCTEIGSQTDSLRSTITGSDLTRRVASCPDWNVGQLVRHLGGGQRWAARTVALRADQPLGDNDCRDLMAYIDECPDIVEPWLGAGAAQLATALRQSGPDAEMWTPVPGGTAAFYARRFTHETLIHRADATLALSRVFTVDPVVAIDAVDEWLELRSLPMHFEINPTLRDMLGPGRTIGLRATDIDADWIIDLTGEVIDWRRLRAPAPVAVQVAGPLVDLLLIIYRRITPDVDGITVAGDVELLEHWLGQVGFGRTGRSMALPVT